MSCDTYSSHDSIFPQGLLSHTQLTAVVREKYEELVQFRRDIHRNPELSWNEYRTADKIIAMLEKAGLAPQYVGQTGIFVDIGTGDIAAAFRGDIDALPLQEETGLSFASETDGVCHACGHDVHLTVALGVALILAQLNELKPFNAAIRVIFQPAEEKIPGGARKMIEEGIFQGVERAFALHCDPRSEVGNIAVLTGAISSASDTIGITLHGQGGHTSRPHLTEDIVFALAAIATQVPVVVSRRTDARDVINIVWGEIHAGSAPNAIPAQGYLAGTMRCLNGEVWRHAGELIDEVVNQIAAAYKVTADIEHVRGVPPVVNTEAEVQAIQRAAQEEIGADHVAVGTQSMGGEDFGWVLQEVPGAMFRLGTRPPCGKVYDLHRGDYIIDERAIAVGLLIMLRVALEYLDYSME